MLVNSVTFIAELFSHLIIRNIFFYRFIGDQALYKHFGIVYYYQRLLKEM